jgi:transcription termination factor Rho
MYDILELSKKLLPELKDIAKELKIKKAETLKKQDLIYKILDQQAIEATEIKPEIKPEKENKRSPLDMSKEDFESARIRGKRPRTLKPIIKRPIESVISVSPDDLKRPETKPADRPEPIIKPERPPVKPDLFSSPDKPKDDRSNPRWRPDQRPEPRPDHRSDDRSVRKERFEKPFNERPEKRRFEPAPHHNSAYLL